jgi:hypothetical protein
VEHLALFHAEESDDERQMRQGLSISAAQPDLRLDGPPEETIHNHVSTVPALALPAVATDTPTMTSKSGNDSGPSASFPVAPQPSNPHGSLSSQLAQKLPDVPAVSASPPLSSPKPIMTSAPQEVLNPSIDPGVMTSLPKAAGVLSTGYHAGSYAIEPAISDDEDEDQDMPNIDVGSDSD